MTNLSADNHSVYPSVSFALSAKRGAVSRLAGYLVMGRVVVGSRLFGGHGGAISARIMKMRLEC